MQRWRIATSKLIWGLVLLGVLLVVLFFARRLNRGIDRRIRIIALVVVAAAWGSGVEIFPAEWLLSVAPTFEAGVLVVSITLILFAVAYTILAVSEYYAMRSLSAQSASWFLFFGQRLKAQASGLGWVRGCVLGAFYLGLHTVVVFAAGHWKLGGTFVGWLNDLRFFRLGWGLVYAVSIPVLFAILMSWSLVGFPVALARRATSRPWIVIGVPALLWIFTCYFPTGASAFPLSPMLGIAFLQGLFFASVLYYRDILTAMAAVFTVQFWLMAYPLAVVYQMSDTILPELLLLIWFLLFLFALFVYFLPQIQGGFRRARAVFE